MRYLILLIFLLAVAGCAANASYDMIHGVRAHSITDGDTFKVDVPGWHPAVGHALPVRVRGIDTPEIYGKCDSERALAQEAKAFTELRVLSAQRILLRKIERDGFFRLVADVELDGEDLGEALIDADLGRAYDGKAKRLGWCQ